MALGARRQAALYYSRKRVRSLRSEPRLHRTATLERGGSIPVSDFPNPLIPITFRMKVIVEDDVTTGDVLLETDGSPSFSLTMNAGVLTFAYGTFSATTRQLAVGEQGQLALSMRPGDAQVRLWLNEELLICEQYQTPAPPPAPWATGGNLLFYDATTIKPLCPLDIYDCQRPRHFGTSKVADDDEMDSLLFRAAIATFMVDEFPFLGESDC